ncbi:MAG: M60 family metallopeptidase [Rikenellaceae bacterium]|nr:M60 family metallopeptidase [Rikenellaceae bacterium]MCL2693174.1 M60 family metallopeptidase [Rikenellaceae bacterium]
MKKLLFSAALSLAAMFVVTSCKSVDNVTPLYINVSTPSVDFDRYPGSREVGFDSNAGELEAVVTPIAARSWCNVKIEGTRLVVSATNNTQSGVRSATITLTGRQGKGVEATVNVSQRANTVNANQLPNDVKISVASATASEFSPGQPIENSFDGNMGTLYHSRWSGRTQFPVTLTYNFNNVPAMDYLVYHARSDGGTNGNFRRFDLYVAHGGNALAKYGEYDFNGSSGYLSFSETLRNVTAVQFVVHSGMGDSQGQYVSCAEMEFFARNTSGFDYLSIFTDHSCSELRPGIGQSQIDAIPNVFFRDMAADIFLNLISESDRSFRVQEYRAWVHPTVQAAENKTAPYSLRDNPTGIFVRANEDLIVFVGDTYGQNISIVSQDLTTNGWGTQHTYPLSRGINKIKAKAKGLIYVQYYSMLGEAAPRVKINFVTGAVNGYFDVAKHETRDWTRLLNAAVASDFDLVGKYTHLTFAVDDFKAHTPDGKALVEKYDEMARLQHEFMGLYKHNRPPRNRAYFHVDYNPNTYMYMTSYRTGYTKSTASTILNLSRFVQGGNMWGPAHELGHLNQLRPVMTWTGMGEVSNNIYSMLVQTAFGARSRLITSGNYTSGFNNIVGKGIAHNDIEDVFVKLVPFWQLKLYLHDVLGKTDFYPDLFYHMMTAPEPTTPATQSRFQLNFVRVACDVAQLNLLDFFEAWGFLTPIDRRVEDYGSAQFTITEAHADALRAEILSKGYPNPPHDFTRITDENLELYQ